MLHETAPERQAATAATAGESIAPDKSEIIAEKLANSLETAKKFAADVPGGLLAPGAHVPFRLQRKVNEGERIFHIKDGVFVGSEYGAADLALLRGLGVSRVINITAGSRRVPNFGLAVSAAEWDVNYLNFELNDYIGADPSRAITEGIAALREWSNEEPPRKALVHCSAGLSRSVTVVLAWLMSVHSMSLRDAVVTFTAGRGRPPACNASFWAHLAALERQLYVLPADAAPSYDFLEYVVEDLGTGPTGLGLNEGEVRRLLPLHQWDGYRVMNLLLDGPGI